VWEFQDGTLVELRAEDPRMAEFEERKDTLRRLLKKGEISAGEYVERFKSICLELGSRLNALPPGYSLSKEYSSARVYARKSGGSN
jgi:hypothetical protein